MSNKLLQIIWFVHQYLTIVVTFRNSSYSDVNVSANFVCTKYIISGKMKPNILFQVK